jgi:hypothetical protein
LLLGEFVVQNFPHYYYISHIISDFWFSDDEGISIATSIVATDTGLSYPHDPIIPFDPNEKLLLFFVIYLDKTAMWKFAAVAVVFFFPATTLHVHTTTIPRGDAHVGIRFSCLGNGSKKESVHWVCQACGNLGGGTSLYTRNQIGTSQGKALVLWISMWCQSCPGAMFG